MYQTLKALHVISMFLAFAFFMAPNLMSMRAIRRRDAAGLRQAVEADRLFGGLGGAAIVVGVALGIATVLTGGLSFLSPWLVIAYVLLVTIIVVGRAVVLPRLQRAAEASGSEAVLTPEALAAGGGLPGLLFVPPVLFLIIVADMVIKPFSS